MRKRERRIVLGLLILALIVSGVWGLSRIVRLRPAEDADNRILTAEEPGEGVGRVPVVVRYLGAPEAEEIETAVYFDTYTEGDAPVPAWWNPDEEMAVEWKAPEPHPPVGIDAGGIDWNLCTTLFGAHGLTAEPWELDLMTRIVSREVCGCSRTCWEAVADSILRRVESGHWGSTIYSVLSAVEDNGAWAYDTWPDVWDGEIELYDEIRAVCEDRFYNGAEWDATHFRTEYYHPWAISLYEIDGVYFSLSPWLRE